MKLGVMALVGVDNYYQTYKAQTLAEYQAIQIPLSEQLPVTAVKSEQVIADTAADKLAENNNLANQISTYDNAKYENDFAAAVNKRINVVRAIATDIAEAFGIENVTVQIGSASPNVGAYVETGLPNFFSHSFNSEKIIVIPSDSPILQGGYDAPLLVETFAHEITHIRQVNIQNNQLNGNKTDLGALLVGNSQLKIPLQEAFGLYIIQPAEAHANFVSNAFVEQLRAKGVLP
jgi:hypothetical protein